MKITTSATQNRRFLAGFAPRFGSEPEWEAMPPRQLSSAGDTTDICCCGNSGQGGFSLLGGITPSANNLITNAGILGDDRIGMGEGTGVRQFSGGNSRRKNKKRPMILGANTSITDWEQFRGLRIPQYNQDSPARNFIGKGGPTGPGRCKGFRPFNGEARAALIMRKTASNRAQLLQV